MSEEAEDDGPQPEPIEYWQDYERGKAALPTGLRPFEYYRETQRIIREVEDKYYPEGRP